MNITFNELRQVKHSLPTGSVSRIAQELKISEQTVRNYFGAKKFGDATKPIGSHLQPGPGGGIMKLPDTKIYETALKIVRENTRQNSLN